MLHLHLVLQDADIQNALQSVANSRDVPVGIKDHFSDLLALAEDQPTPPCIGGGGNTRTATAGAQSSAAGNRLNGVMGSTTEINIRRGGRGAALGSKGGHSLRNLDSRRAAEVICETTTFYSKTKVNRVLRNRFKTFEI